MFKYYQKEVYKTTIVWYNKSLYYGKVDNSVNTMQYGEIQCHLQI